MFKLLRYFSMTSLVAFIIVTAVLAAFYRQTALADLIALEESKNVALTRAFTNTLWPQFAPFVTSASGLGGDELRAHPDIARLHQAVLAQMNGLSVLKVKIYNLDGLTVFSTEAQQIGEDKSANAGFLSARSGKVASELTHRDTFSAFEGTLEDRDVLSSYIPVQRGGPTAPLEGVFEVYTDVTSFLESIQRVQRDVIIVVTLSLASLYVALFFIVRRADGIIQRQHIAAKRAEEAQQAARDELEKQVDERTAQLRTSADVGRAAASILDTGQLLREVVNLITDRFGFYYAAVFTLDETGRFAVLREATGEAGRILKERGHQLEVGGQSMVGYATGQRRPHIAPDVGEAVTRFANPLLPDTRSEIALPLVVGDRVLGALDVQSTQAAAFDEDSAAALQSMADQIAIALNNAEQFRHAEAQARAHADLLTAALELTGQLDRDVLFDRVIRRTMELLHADEADIWLPVNDEEIELAASSHLTVVGRRLAKGEELPGTVFATGRAVRVDDSGVRPSYATSFADAPVHAASSLPRAEPARSAAEGLKGRLTAALAVPMMWQGQFTGVLAVTRSQPNTAFDADDERIAQLFAAQAAAALAAANLLEQQRRTLEELDAINRQLTAEAWTTHFDRLPEEARGAQFVRRSAAPASSRLKAAPVEQAWLPEVELVTASRKPVAWSKRADQIVSSPFEAAMAAPIVLRGEVIGALQVGEAGRPRPWSAEDLEFIQAVADQVALAVENARLIEETRRAAQRERALSESTDKIRRGTDIERILQMAAEELARHLHAARVAVRLSPDIEASAGNGYADSV